MIPVFTLGFSGYCLIEPIKEDFLFSFFLDVLRLMGHNV